MDHVSVGVMRDGQDVQPVDQSVKQPFLPALGLCCHLVDRTRIRFCFFSLNKKHKTVLLV